ncbi:MAG: ABC transporter substrate-binding protein, partial [Deltaproteobacteria bacterium]|nr:ABC transporter substrate-binding protein [Deltaproteobacteria bacterium]
MGRMAWLGLALVAGLGLAAPAWAQPLRIGVAGPLSGDQAAIGEELRNGSTIAVEEWNARGGVLGKKIEILWGDDQRDPKQGVAIAHKFVSAGVAGVIG